MYLDFSDYQNMGGTLDFTTFDNYAYQAGTIINLYTYNRLRDDLRESPETIPESVERCEFELIRLVQAKTGLLPTMDVNGNLINSGSVASQSNDGVSVSYSAPMMLSASEIMSSYKDEIKNIVSMYLNEEYNSKGELLLYKGVY